MGRQLQFTSTTGNRPLSLSQCFDNTLLDSIINGKNVSKPIENHKIKTMEQTFTWTYNIIKSCNNDFHFDCADVLISLFKVKYGDSDMVLQLRQLRENKWVSIHGILV